jgi:hypothetical protein
MASAQPARYVLWTKEEEATLLNELASAMTIEEIAKQHSRTVGAINSRRNQIGERMLQAAVETGRLRGCKTDSLFAKEVDLTPSDRMNSIDTEIANLQARITVLETIKADVPPIKSANELLVDMRRGVENNKPRKNESPIATACRFSGQSQLRMLESIVVSLNEIHSRLDRLEARTS